MDKEALAEEETSRMAKRRDTIMRNFKNEISISEKSFCAAVK